MKCVHDNILTQQCTLYIIGTNINIFDIPMVSLVNPVESPTATICSDTTSTKR